MQEWAKRFYNSKAWRQCRESYIAKRVAIDGGLCQTCHKEPGYIVHHKVWLTPDNITDPMIALNLSNLHYDCHICHNREKENVDKPRYYFNDSGELILLPDDEE